MYELRENKKKAREEFTALRNSIPKEEKALLDKKIISKFISLASYRHADTILAYYPMGSEVDVRPLILYSLSLGKRVALPFCPLDDNLMRFYYITSLDDLIIGKYGIPSPSEDSELFTDKSSPHSIIMVPALAFDKNGYRLGYGKGYYDRYIVGYGGTIAGFSYSNLVFDTIPRGKYDISVDYIVTDKGVAISNRQGGCN